MRITTLNILDSRGHGAENFNTKKMSGIHPLLQYMIGRHRYGVEVSATMREYLGGLNHLSCKERLLRVGCM